MRITTCDLKLMPAPGTLLEEAAPYILDKRLVHKTSEQNVLLSHIEPVPPTEPAELAVERKEPREDHFRGRLYIQREHDFFFEHARDHVPGLYLIEAGRQMSVAIAHMFYGVPFGTEFILTDLAVEFRSMATLDHPIIAHNMMSHHVFRKGRLASMRSGGVIRQGDADIARIAGTMVLMDKDMMKRLERRNSKCSV